MKSIARIASAAALAALVAAAPAAAGAATRSIRVKPASLSPFNVPQDDDRTAVFNGGGTGPVLFWKIIRLPRGATITGLSYRRIASGAEETIVGIDRVRPGESPAWERIYAASSTEVSQIASIGSIVKGTPAGASPRVQRGWTYFVLVQATPLAYVGDITVRYRVP